MTRTSYALNADHMNYFLFMLSWTVLVLSALIYVSVVPVKGAIVLTFSGIALISLTVITLKLFMKVDEKKPDKKKSALKYSKLVN